MPSRPSFVEHLTDFFGVDDDWQRPRPEVGRQDLVLALAVGLFGVASLELVRSVGAFEDLDAPPWAQQLAVLTGAVLLVGRRRWPLVVASLAALHMFAVGVSMPAVMGQVSLQGVYFVALLSGVAWARDRRVMLVVVSAIVLFMFAWIAWQFAVGSAIQGFIDEEREQRYGLVPPVPANVLLTLLINAVYFGGAVLGGAFAWRAARQRARLEDQSATIAAQAEELRDRAVTHERLRIARELHDVVAHHVSAMGIQAGAARHVIDRDPAAAARSLGAVEELSREAVTQMRGLLGTLRSREASGTEDDRTTDPGVEDLPDLVAAVPGGLRTLYDLVERPEGAAAAVPRPLALSIYRTVQEALTNVVRHSTADRVSVVLRVDRETDVPYAEVEVLDNGHPRGATSASGLGQLGIRERAATHRGSVEIGPRVGGGYRVRVRYPLADPGAVR